MRFFYRFMLAWSAFDLAIQRTRRDQIDKEMMHGDRPDVLTLRTRRDRINREIDIELRVHDRWSLALQHHDLNRAARA